LTTKRQGGGFFAEVSLVAGGKIIALASLFLLGIVVARFIGPDEYGRYATALALILLLDAILGSPLDWAVVRFGTLHADDAERVEGLLGATFKLKAAVAVALFLTALVFSEPIAGLLFPEAPSASKLLLSLLAATIALLALRSLASYLQLKRSFRKYALLDLATAIVRIALVAPLLIYGIDDAWAFVGLYGLAAAIVFVGGLLWIRPTFMRAATPSREDRRALIGFCGSTTLIMILGAVSGRADILMLGALAGGAQTGLYAAAAHVAMLATMIAGYAAVVIQPRIIPAAREGEVRRLWQSNLRLVAALLLLVVPVTIWGLPYLFPLLYGERYLPAVPALQVLVIGTVLDLLTMPVLQPFGIQLCPRQSVWIEIVIASLFVLLAPLVASQGIVMMAWLMTLIRLGKLMGYGVIAWQHAGRVESRLRQDMVNTE